MFKGWQQLRAGEIDAGQWDAIMSGIARSPGTCMTMGTAATMMSAVEALGLSLPGASSIPAPDSRHAQMATATGKRLVEMVWEDLTPAKILTNDAFDNAVTCVLAMGGSTNALVHLIAMARRAGCSLDLDRFDELARKTPLIANIRPAGKYLMEDFYYAGGLRALLERIRGKLRTQALTVNGRTLGENIEGARVFNDDVILPLDKPVIREGSLAVLRGNLAPDGAVIKPAAAEARLHKHRGKAVVFESYDALSKGIDDPALDIDGDSVLVLQNAGPLGGPGMPEWGQLPIPKKLLQKGVRDMVRISDARMSGTSYGACVLHVAPEAYVGGNLALVRTGDMIAIDVPNRRLDLRVDDAELARRRSAWQAPAPRFGRGYGWMFSEHILQANEGCDMDFLQTQFGPATGEPDIF